MHIDSCYECGPQCKVVDREPSASGQLSTTMTEAGKTKKKKKKIILKNENYTFLPPHHCHN